MSDKMIRNATIEGTSLSIVEGKLTGLVQVRYNQYQTQIFTVEVEEIENLLQTIDALSWEELKDKSIRVKATDEEIKEVGNFLEEKWWKHVRDTDSREDSG
jgi:hypothetical protein